MTPLVSFFGISFFFLLILRLFYYEACFMRLCLYKVSKTKWQKLLSDISLSSLIAREEKLSMILRFAQLFSFLVLGIFLKELMGFCLVLGEGVLGGIIEILGFGIGLLFVALILYVLREAIGKSILKKDVRDILRSGWLFLGLLTAVFTPVYWGLRMLLGFIRKGDSGLIREEKLLSDIIRTEYYLDGSIAELTTYQLKIIANTVLLPGLEASDILIPRNQVEFLDLKEDGETNIIKAKRMGSTRFPLCNGGLDSCVGLIHIKDIFQYEGDLLNLDLTQFEREIIRLSDSLPLDTVLRRLLKAKSHMALVVDAFGGTVGIITLEDVLEELVGDIQDEFDSEEANIVYLGEGTYRVSGLTALHEFESKTGFAIDRSDISTFGGFIVSEIGKIPNLGDEFKLKGLSIKIEDVNKKQVLSSIVKIGQETSEGD